MRKKTPVLFNVLAFCTVISSAGTLLGSCSPVVSQHGNMVKEYQVENVKEGESTRSDVLRILGSPTTQSTFNPNVWYYIGQETEKYGILDQNITNERILVVNFNDEGVVETIAPFDSSRQDIPYERSKTPTHGNQLTLMQQLLGNLGRFNAADSSATDY
ncbi:MAG: outer membrane protein assembly factor BamE [Alphaproteobacteria bacterium]|nr:outer membrane protein assembly factor BamE [Alphaproteobacteria bacterium]